MGIFQKTTHCLVINVTIQIENVLSAHLCIFILTNNASQAGIISMYFFENMKWDTKY